MVAEPPRRIQDHQVVLHRICLAETPAQAGVSCVCGLRTDRTRSLLPRRGLCGRCHAFAATSGKWAEHVWQMGQSKRPPPNGSGLFTSCERQKAYCWVVQSVLERVMAPRSSSMCSRTLSDFFQSANRLFHVLKSRKPLSSCSSCDCTHVPKRCISN